MTTTGSKKRDPKRPTSQKKKRARNSSEERALSPWRQVVVDIAAHLAEPFASTLVEQGALGVEIHDDTTRSMPGRLAALTGRATIVAPFSRVQGLEAKVTGALAHVASFFDDASDMSIEWCDLFVEDWNAAFKKEWKPLTISDRVWIVPSWEEGFVTPDGCVALHLDPGLAFGTGTHETTRLCAQGIDEMCRTTPPKTMIDVGTGTGILALAALRLGVSRAHGTDIDPVAVKAALENAKENKLDDRFTADESLPDASGAFPLVVANILAGPLIKLAPMIANAVAPGGRLMLSGILDEQAHSVKAAYVETGLRFISEAHENGWTRLDFGR